jgi:hypothetical protein
MSKLFKDTSSNIKSIQIKWSWIKYVASKKKLPNNNLKNIFTKNIFLRGMQILNFFSSFFSNKETGGSLLYCNEKHYKNIFIKFFRIIKLEDVSYSYYSPISVDWIRFKLNIKKFHISEYKWQGNEKQLSSLNFVKLIDEIIYKDLKKIKPNRIFLVEGDSYIHNLINKNAKLLKIKTITIQNGYNIYLDPVITWKNINSDIYISRGYANTKFLKNHSTAKFITTGILNNKRNNFYKNKLYDVCFILQPDINNKFLDYIFYVSKKYKKLNFLIKLHPSSKFKTEKKINNIKNITVYKKTVNMDYLKNSRFIISEYSSVLIESLEYDCVPIAVYKFYDKTILKYLSLKKLGFCFRDFRSLKKIENKIFQKKHDSFSHKRNINKNYFLDNYKQSDIKIIKNLCK